MSKSAAIREMLKKNMDVKDIAAKAGVSPAYVHTVRWQMKQKKGKKKAAAAPAPAADPVNHPPHYKANGMEAIDVIEAFKLNYRVGNAAKYLLRHMQKGNALEDLKKARWYIDREIAACETTAGQS